MGSYHSKRNNINNDDLEAPLESSATDATKKEASTKLASTAAKGAATYFGGPAASKTVDALANTNAGKEVFNKGGEAINKIPGMGMAAKKLDDSGILDNADKAMNFVDGSSIGGANKQTGGSSSNTEVSSSSLSNNKKSNLVENLISTGEESGKESSKSNIPLKGSLIAFSPVLMIGFPILLVVAIILLPFTLLSHWTSAFSEFEDAIGISHEIGFFTGGIEYTTDDKNKLSFYKRVVKKVEEYKGDNINVDALKIVATYHVINHHNEKIKYNNMTDDKINDIVVAMLEYNEESDSYYYNGDKFRKELTDNLFPHYFPKEDSEVIEKYVDEVFEYIDLYYDFIGYNPNSSCSAIGSCNYKIKGFYIHGGKGNVMKDMDISNLKVRLMQTGISDGHNYGGTFGLAMPGEELIDFEKYVLGVAYAEVDTGVSDEAFKAQLVAARSYALARATDMGGFRSLKQEGDNWVLQIANSTADQVYCDPDKGCSTRQGQWQQVYSGTNVSGIPVHKYPLAADARARTLANETMGEVIVNSQGYIVYAGFTNTEQKEFERLAKSGMSYKEILLTVYNSGKRNYGARNIEKMSCNTTGDQCSQAVTGDYASWKQYQGPWVSVKMGNSGKTIKQIGCLATSIAMQVARSGVSTNVEGEFNPGSFVEYMNTHGGFNNGGELQYAGVTRTVPSFHYSGRVYVSGYTKDQKYNTLTDLLNKGYYVVAEVKGNTGQHWVAVVSTQNGEVTMMDPGSNFTSMWEKYNYKNTSTFTYFTLG